METPIRSLDEVSRLYKHLADQISNKNEEEVRRVYKELLRSGVPLVEIVGMAMASVHKVESRRESGGSKAAIVELPEARRVPIDRRQTASVVALHQVRGARVHIDRSERASVVLRQSRGDDRDDWSPNQLMALQPTQAEPTHVRSEAEAPETVAVNRADDSDVHQEAFIDAMDNPRLISIAAAAQSLRSGPDLQLTVPFSFTAAATRAIIVLMLVIVATAGIDLLLRTLRPVDENRADALHSTVVLPPTLAVGVGAARFFGALSPTIAVASMGLSEEGRPTVIMSGAAPTEKAPVIAAAPAIVPPEVPVSPVDVSALLHRGDALLATGDIASARLFYEKAAMAGDAMAALRLGGSYDTGFLARLGLTGVHGDRALAARWYRRANELGASEAEVLLKSTENKQD